MRRTLSTLKRRGSRLVGLCVAALVACGGCGRVEPSSEGLGVAPPKSSAMPSAAPSAPIAARKFLDAATAFARQCQLANNTIYDIWGYDVYDECPLPEADRSRLKAAWSELEAQLADAAGGQGESFVTQARLFAEWIDLAVRIKDSRGTLLRYQELAGVWNEWQPNDKVPVDPPEVVELYHKGHNTKGMGLPMFWRKGFDGPRL